MVPWKIITLGAGLCVCGGHHLVLPSDLNPLRIRLSEQKNFLKNVAVLMRLIYTFELDQDLLLFIKWKAVIGFSEAELLHFNHPHQNCIFFSF